MLETAEERIKLLKKGLSGKEIEALYIEQNNFRIIRYKANEFAIVHSNYENTIPGVTDGVCLDCLPTNVLMTI